MRIGVISTDEYPTPPPRYGGTENVVAGLCRGLKQAGHDVTLAAIPGSRCKVDTIPIRASAEASGGTGKAAYALKAYDALVDADVALIHDHTQIGFLIGNPKGRPVITTNHNQFTPERALLYREATARHGVGVVAISSHHASTAHQARVPLAGWVHNGIDVNAIPVGTGKGGYVAVLSRMSPGKGIREAILIAQQVGVPIRIAAKMQSPAEQAYYAEQVKPALDDYPDADFISEVSAEGKYTFLGDAIALLNPLQWHEPFGLAMIEALACGTPVLSTLMGSAPEIVTHGTTGYLRNKWHMLDVDLERAAALDRAACRRAAEARFSIDRMAANYLDLYAAALGDKAAA